MDEFSKETQEILNRISKLTNVEQISYTFEWNYPDGLRYISFDFIMLCIDLIEKCKFKLEKKEEKNFDRIVITNNITNICKPDYTEETLKEMIKNNEIIGQENIFNPSFNYHNNFVCLTCNYSKCPKNYAGYIYYLITQGLIEDVLKDREEYRRNEFKSDYFTFSWETENGVKEVPEKTFNNAMALLENNMVSVEQKLNSENNIKIHLPITCSEYSIYYDDFSKLIENKKKDTLKWIFVTRNTNKLLYGCNSWPCAKAYCIFDVAGYLFYLKKSGKWEQVAKDRKYYEEHKEEIENSCLENQEKQLDKVKEKQKKDRTSEIQEILEYKSKNPDIEQIIDKIFNEKGLHISIEGARGSGKFNLAEKICKLLYSAEKITNEKPEYISLFNLAFSKTIEDRQVYTISEMNIQEKNLYVLTDIKEFIREYKRTVSAERSYVSQRRMQRVIELITTIFDEHYIIIASDKKSIDELITLDPKLKFIYQNNRYELQNLSIDELFDLYCKNLNIELSAKISNNDELKNNVKENFVDYVGINADFFPFYNEELSKYLATYSISKKDFVFPENIYKKETVEESLKNIIGLESVKDNIKKFEKYALYTVKAKNLGLQQKKSNLHMIFTGNPGTGKTTIARIMAKMLFDLGLISENKLVEVERKDLVAEYIGQTAPKTNEVIQRAMGGVLFIDEAYTLAPTHDNPRDFGTEAIATLIKAMEDHKDDLVVIFAGYRDEMKTFIDINPGISSRIGYTFHFEDYSKEELKEIFYTKISNMGYKIDKNIDNKLLIILEYYQKRKNFGNGRFIDKLIQEIIMKHALRDTKQIDIITADDIPSIEELNNTNYSDKQANEMLDKLIGLHTLKNKLKEFQNYIQFLKRAEKENISAPNQNLHMIFTGNPGTGKTTVARIVAKMLFDLGMIHENKLIEVERKDLIAEYIGQTAVKTNEVIEKAMGGVLFVDEAYSLAPTHDNTRDFGHEAIATLIKAMEDHKGEFVVIFAGYRDEMKTFTDINPGIASRIGYTFHFEDYNAEDLKQMFTLKITNMGYDIDEKIYSNLMKILTYFSKRKNFGNGRFVDKLVQEVIMKHASRNPEDIRTIAIEDIPTIEDLNNTNTSSSNASEMLNNLVGLQDLKEKIKEFEKYIKFLKRVEKENINLPNQNLHMIFTGNPGTGKTTVARIIAKMLFDLGIIHENKLIEVERKDLVAGYVGQTAIKTNEVIEKAMGGVLFIDEAYSLAQGKNSQYDFGAEAIATLIKAMEDHKGEFIVIFAGYKNEMKSFIDINPGIASRIGYSFNFTDYTDVEYCEIYYRKITSLGFTINDDAKPNVEAVMKYFCNVENNGNGRFVDKVVQNTLLKLADKKDNITVISKECIPTIQEMIKTMLTGDSMINPDLIDSKSLKKTAIHEIGHATIRYLLQKTPGIKKITINAEGAGTLGYVRYNLDNFKYTYSKKELMNNICSSLGGMCNEIVYLGEHESGNTSDLRKASRIVKDMITKYGMSNLGLYTYSDEEDVNKFIADEANSILSECYERTIKLLEQNKDKTKIAIDYLLKHKEIDEDEFVKCMEE